MTKAPDGAGSISQAGYRIIKAHGHPMANDQGNAFEHRVLLFDAIGPSGHPCHWCNRPLVWLGPTGVDKLCIDHLDDNKVNNDLANLVPSCVVCNAQRGLVDYERPRRTHCRRGHLFIPENEIWRNGKRTCRQCKRDAQNRRNAERRALGWKKQHRGPEVWVGVAD